ncbi:MAG TPA: WD40 repeat domain-containing protein, partial [Spirochaetia bacterium]|nr:WD40 repeat domain-containing protein [Spirochaetia bacterium]
MKQKGGSFLALWLFAAVRLFVGTQIAEADDFHATQVRFEPTVNQAVDVELSRFGSYTAIADWSDGNSVRVLDENWELLWKHRQQVYWGGTFRNASILQFAPDESFVIFPAYRTDNDIAVVDPKTGEAIAVLPDHDATVVSLALSPDGKLLVSATHDELFLWRRDGRGFTVAEKMREFAPAVQSIAFSPDGKLVAVTETQQMQRRLVVFDVTSGHLAQSYTFENEDRNLSREYAQVVFSPDGSWIAAGYSDSLRLWRTASAGSKAQATDGPPATETGSGFHFVQEAPDIELGPVHSVRFSPDGRLLLTGHSRDVRVWRLAEGGWEPAATFTPHHGQVRDLEFSIDGTRLAIGGRSESSGAGLWSVSGIGPTPTGEVVAALGGRISAAQKRFLDDRIAGQILASVDPLTTAPRDMFETEAEYKARLAKAKIEIASKIQEETERAFSAERSTLPGAMYQVSVPLQAQGSYDINSKSYTLWFMDIEAAVHLERDPARELYRNWQRARVVSSRFQTQEGTTYADFRVSIPGIETQFPLGMAENPFTGERLDRYGARVPAVSVGPSLLLRSLRIEGLFPSLYRY